VSDQLTDRHTTWQKQIISTKAYRNCFSQLRQLQLQWFKNVFTFSLATIGIDTSSMSTNIAACSRKFSARLASSPLPLVLSSAATVQILIISSYKTWHRPRWCQALTQWHTHNDTTPIVVNSVQLPGWPWSSTLQNNEIRPKMFCCFWSNTLEFTPIVCSWSNTDTDSVLCASEDRVILQSIRNTSIAPTWQFRL